jgi:hypothetical protein
VIKRKRLRVWLSLASLSFGGAVLAAGCAGLCRPSWYQPVSIDFSRIQADRDRFVRLGDSIGDALNAGRSVEFMLDEAELNRALVGRREIWPDAGGWELEGARDPVVGISNEGVRFGAMTEARGGFRVVLSCMLGAEPAGEQVRLICRGVRVGALPVPAGAILARVTDALQDGGSDITTDGDAILLDNDWVWPNGKQRFRVEEIEFSEGKARIRLGPLR